MNKQELKSWFEDAKFYSRDYIISKIDQLEEYETLSPSWIEENEEKMKHRNAHPADLIVHKAVPSERLQKLIVLKQKNPVVPIFVAEYIKRHKKEGQLMYLMYEMQSEWHEFTEGRVHELQPHTQWVIDNESLFIRAWLDSFTIEQEPKYRVPVFSTLYLNRRDNGVFGIGSIPSSFETEFTEQEIKGYDERYWAFAKPVEEME